MELDFLPEVARKKPNVSDIEQGRENYELGIQLMESGQLTEAILAFTEAVFFLPDNAQPLVSAAECFVYMSDYQSAIRYYRRAMWLLQKQEVKSESPLQVGKGDWNATQKSFKDPIDNIDLNSTVDSDGITFTPQTLKDIKRRLSGILDALSIVLFEFSDLEQALQCTKDSLAFLRELEIEAKKSRLKGKSLEKRSRSRNRLNASNTSINSEKEGSYFSYAEAEAAREEASLRRSIETVLIHQCTYLIALQQEEDVERIIEAHIKEPSFVTSHLSVDFTSLLTYLYCNRQAFRPARELLDEFASRLYAKETTRGPLDRSLRSRVEEQSSGARAIERRSFYRSQDSTSSFIWSESSLADNEERHRSNGRGDRMARRRRSYGRIDMHDSSNGTIIIARQILAVTFQHYRAKALELNDLGTISKCIDVYPDDIDSRFARAKIYVARKNYKLSIKDLFQCVKESNGTHKEAVELMTAVLFQLGNSSKKEGNAGIEEAITYYSESLKWRSDNMLVLIARGDCYMRLEDYENALKDYKTVAQLEAHDTTAKKRIAFLYDSWGKKLHKTKQVQEAEEKFTLAILADDTNPSFFYHRAICRFELDEPRYALRDVLSCQQLNSPDPIIRAFIVRNLGTPENPTSKKNQQQKNLPEIIRRHKETRTINNSREAKATANARYSQIGKVSQMIHQGGSLPIMDHQLGLIKGEKTRIFSRNRKRRKNSKKALAKVDTPPPKIAAADDSILQT